MRFASYCVAFLLSLELLLSAVAKAGPPSERLLPRSTKGYVSVARPAEFTDRWDQTQFGQMLNDEIMQPFVKDLRKQLRDKYSAVEEKLGITWDDLEGVPGGEMSLALLERKGKDAALAITIDVTGHEQQSQTLLAAIEKRFAARGGRKQDINRSGTTLHTFDVPAAEAGDPRQTTMYFIKDNVLCGVDDAAEAEAMLGRFSGAATDNLASIPAYGATMDRCRREAKNLEAEARWFVEPFGFIFAARTLQKKSTRKPDKQDIAKILVDVGFDAIQGAGGFVNQLVDGHIEFLHRTAIYAPPVKGKENDPLRWNLSMRILQLPNAPGFEPQSWVPRMSASYTTFQLRIGDAFDNLGPLFDAVQGHENAWANTIDSWKTDVYGPKVDVRKEFIDNMGERITVVTDYDTPISVASERSLVAIEAKNEAQLAATLDRWMSKEPDVERRAKGQLVIWERVPPQQGAELEIDVPGFTPLQSDAEEKDEEDEERERVLPNSAVCVALGHMMMASDIDYLREILTGYGQRDRLASSSDYQQVVEVMNGLAPGEHSGWSFGRTDEEFRPTYELIRQGKMPEAKSILGKILNNMLTTDVERDEGVLRKQRIDGSSLPNFEAVRRYLGPAGRVLRSEKDGWLITGAVLNKEAP